MRPPGRENRLGEAPFRDLHRLTEETARALGPLLDRPFAFFGHSMGAVVAFELARRLHADPDAATPTHLVVSGHRPPACPSRHPPIWHLPDREFLEAIQERFGEIPPEIAREPELMRLLLPCLKADVALVERHDWADEPLLNLPITAMGGLEDASTLPEEVEAWGRATTGPFSFVLFSGDHFFIQSARDQVIDVIAQAIGREHEPSILARMSS